MHFHMRSARYKAAMRNGRSELQKSKHTEEKEHEAQLEAIFASSQSAMLVTRDGIVQKINERGQRLLGIGEGDSTACIYCEKHHRAELVSAVDTEGAVKKRPIQLKAAGRGTISAEISVFPFVHSGKPALLAWISDATELARAKTQAREASNAKSDFLAGMSHEIRTPMNAIVGLTHLCMKTELSDKQQDYLSRIQGAAGVLLTLIDDILDLSKIRSGMFSLHYTQFDLDEVLKSLWDRTEPKAREKSLSFSIDTAPTLPRFFIGDSMRLLQIFSNLCSNAVKFTDEGAISLKIDHGKTDAIFQGHPVEELRVTISDTGIGIKQSEMGCMFDPFFRADDSMTREYSGSGLGLPICKHLVESMGGTIWAESEPGRGSSFHFTAKLALVTPHTAESTSGDTQHALHKLHEERQEINANILLVEDNEINQEVAVAVLQEFGALVDVAQNGREALDMLESQNYDIVLMDIQMPVMDGLQAATHIRREMGYDAEALPIIAMTAHALKEDYEKSLSAGMNDHITKPIDPDKLHFVLQKWTRQLSKRKTPGVHRPKTTPV